MHLGQHMQIFASGSFGPRKLSNVSGRVADESVGKKSSACQTANGESSNAVAIAAKFAATFTSTASTGAATDAADDEPAPGPRTNRATGPNVAAAAKNSDGHRNGLGTRIKTGQGADAWQKSVGRR